MSRRVLLFVLLALAVPLPALALTGDRGPSDIAVSVSLGGCGVSDTQVMCELNASWNPIPDATHYTASVTAADGSVTDFGTVGAGSATLYVPYSGPGTYTVQVLAWGTPEGSDREHVIARDRSDSTTSKPADPGPSDTELTPPDEDAATPPSPSDGDGDGTVTEPPAPAPAPEPAPCDPAAEPQAAPPAASATPETQTTPDATADGEPAPDDGTTPPAPEPAPAPEPTPCP